MKILIATMPYQGHVGPTIRTALRLVQRGHDVRWYTSAEFKGDIQALGARWVPMTKIPASEPASLRKCIERFQAIAPAQIWELRAALKAEPADVILADPTVLAAIQIWAEGGPIYAMLSMLPLLAPTPDMPLILQGTIPGFEYPRPDLPNLAFVGPMLPQPSPLALVAPDWFTRDVDPAKPIVHVTQGTIATDPKHLVLPTLKACADLPVTVIATAPRNTIDAAEIPPNAIVVDWVSHSFLVPRCAVFITNGGYAGLQMALACGVPTIVGGGTEDKEENARRVAWAGTGIDLNTPTPMPNEIRAAMEILGTTPRYYERAQELAMRCAQTDAPMTIALLLERLWPSWQADRPMPARAYDLTEQAVA